ncbi:flavin reductase family protein [Sphingobium sp. H39-3-25]|uniref:flavin reductase family protein n=1 Tax=Sphingobium arseniciresistens TaxID=3030834 RepID=UPI0023B8921F|nr:flavin reductase family protein [Sphingobium arseniciresistens]
MTGYAGAFHFYRPAEGSGLRRDPLKAVIAPRPIGWISTLAADGTANLAPYSFFNMVCDAPPLVAFSSIGRKDTLRNAEATGEFTCNLATRDLADPMNVTAAMHSAGIDEFAAAGLERLPGTAVSCPRVAASPAALECRLVDVHRLRGHDGREAGAWLVIGEIVGVHLARMHLVDGLFDTTHAGIIQRAGYADQYAEAMPASFFSMSRPPRIPQD